MSGRNEYEKRWKDYHNNKELRKEMSEDIQQVWEYAERINIDPRTIKPRVTTMAERQESSRKSMQLRVHATSVATAIINSFDEDDEFCALLFDVDGCLVAIYSNEVMRKWLRERGIVKWGKWTEEEIGPNIFSIGIKRKNTIVLEGYQNYGEFMLEGIWYFSPIETSSGDISGGLAIVTKMENKSGLFEKMVDYLVKGIELNFGWFNMMQKSTDGTKGMGFLTIDMTGGKRRLMTMNDEVFKMVGLPIEDFYYQPLDEYIDKLPSNKEFWKIIQNRTQVSDRSISLKCHNKTVNVYMSTSDYLIPKMKVNALVIVFNSDSRIQKLVSKKYSNTAKYSFDTIVGESDAFSEAVSRARISANSDSNVFIMGESGTGKDVVAQAIHNGSNRASGPFVALNCAAFSKELIASELFGYEEGSFTGAKKGGSMGKFEIANNGTLFLDEIGDMALDVQAVLLRTLEERTITKVGGNRVIHVNVRIIAATNQNLYDKMKKGLFREDLFYRLGVARIIMPPLRARSNDVLLLADSFIKAICSRQNRSLIRLTKDAALFLLSYHWPGNVRELQNLLEGIISTYNEDVIDSDIIMRYLSYEGIHVTQSEQRLVYETSEKELIVRALSKHRGNCSKAASSLGMSRSTFYRRLAEYGLKK
jgi:transcriptional regulator with PAS, ATPase and Fis domain